MTDERLEKKATAEEFKTICNDCHVNDIGTCMVKIDKCIKYKCKEIIYQCEMKE